MPNIPELKEDQPEAIDNTLVGGKSYADFAEARGNYYTLIKKNRATVKPKSRQAFSVKSIGDFLANAEYLVISVGLNNMTERSIVFCLQKIVKNNDGTFDIIEDNVISNFLPELKTKKRQNNGIDLCVSNYEDFRQAQVNYYKLIHGDFNTKRPRSRHAFSVSQILEFITGAEYLVISVGIGELVIDKSVVFCFQKVIKNADGSLGIVEDIVITDFVGSTPTHPPNGIPNT